LAEEFHENWEKAGQPVVLEGLLKGTEVIRNWQQDDYLRYQFRSKIFAFFHCRIIFVHIRVYKNMISLK